MAPVFLIGGILYFTNWRASAQVAAIPQPAGWTAFDAYWKMLEPSQSVNLVGRFHRASDGSTRQESYNDRGELLHLRIINIHKKETYRYVAQTQRWTMQRVQYPESGYTTPPGWRVDTPGLTQMAQAYEGLPAYEFRDRDGYVRTMVPALNFHPVRLSGPGGYSRQFTNIRIRPQSADLFLPPRDVTAFEHIEEPLVALEFTTK
jgi:hypothetical protein